MGLQPARAYEDPFATLTYGHAMACPYNRGAGDDQGSRAENHSRLGTAMMASTRILKQAAYWLAALALLACSSALVYAQGCAMCYTSAAASKAGALHALRSGILILLLPVLAMCSGISVVIYRSRNRFLGAAEWSSEHDSELRAMLFDRKDLESPDPQERSPLPIGGNTLPKVNGPPAADNGRPQVQS